MEEIMRGKSGSGLFQHNIGSQINDEYIRQDALIFIEEQFDSHQRERILNLFVISIQL